MMKTSIAGTVAGRLNIKGKSRRLWDSWRNYHKYGIAGNKIRIESCKDCQLKCPSCSRSKGLHGFLGNGYLAFEKFKWFADNYPTFKAIELSNYGEMFLNPELKKIIEYAYQNKIRLFAANGVNLNTVNEEVLEALVKYGFNGLSVSLDGASRDTYKIYRQGGDFDKVIENIRKINVYKDKYTSELPLLKWQFILFDHNEHEVDLAEQMAKELGMSFELKLNFDKKYHVPRKAPQGHRYGTAVTADDYIRKNKKIYKLTCFNLWSEPQINWDGKLLGCCKNKWGDFGNVFEEGLEKCFKGKKYLYAKKMLLGKVPEDKTICCVNCPDYQDHKDLIKDGLRSRLSPGNIFGKALLI